MFKHGLTKATLLAVIALAAAPIIACEGDQSESQANTRADGIQQLTIATSSSELKFTPSGLRVKAGEPVRVMLDNSDGTVLHDWSIEEMHVSNVRTEGGAEHMMEGAQMDEGSTGGEDTGDEEMHEMGMAGFALHIAADAGTEAIIEFTPEQAGEYTFFCSVEGHRQAGMEGTLIVE